MSAGCSACERPTTRPGEARDDIEIVYELARRLGRDLGSAKAEDVWSELRSLSPMHAGMSYERLEELGGIQWPCVDESDPGALFIHGRLWDDVVDERAPFQPWNTTRPSTRSTTTFRCASPPAAGSSRTTPAYRPAAIPRRSTSAATDILLSPADGERYGVADGGRVRIVSRRGAVETSARYDPNLRAGLAFMNLHFPDEVATNMLTIDATDPKSGTAEFKATAIRLGAA